MSIADHFISNSPIVAAGSICLLVVSGLTIALVEASAQMAPTQMGPVPTEIQFPEIIDKAVKVRSYTEVGLTPEFVVQGDIVFNSPILAARVLRFESGSRLRFSREAWKESELYVVAERIEIDGNDSALIGWVPPDPPSTPPPSRGRAIPGAPGNSHGAPGSPGSAGATGNQGYHGEPGPTIYLFVGSIKGSTLSIDLRGQDGSVGGEGETGGDGGAGAPGSPAVALRIEIPVIRNSQDVCKASGGRGGDGGMGGPGGRGGVGGRAGDGGALVVLTPVDTTTTVRAKLRVALDGGKGGVGGPGGKGGNGGSPGEGGRGDRGCLSGPPGNPGGRGTDGDPGESGPSGLVGEYIASTLTKSQYRRILGKSGDED